MTLEQIRERLLAGPPGSSQELRETHYLALLLGQGRKNESAFEMAERLVKKTGSLDELFRLVRDSASSDLAQRFEVGRTSSCRLLAAAELSSSQVEEAFRAADRQDDVSSLALIMLATGARALEALAMDPKPDAIAKCSELLQKAHSLASALMLDQQQPMPDLSAMLALLVETDSSEPSR